MNMRQLKQALGIRANGNLRSRKIIIDADTFKDDAFNTMILAPFYNNRRLVINVASLQPSGASEVIIEGTAPFMDSDLVEAGIKHIANCVLEASFALRDGGVLSVTLRFRLANQGMNGGPWFFADSFPQLPTVFAFDPDVVDDLDIEMIENVEDIEEDPGQHALLHQLELHGALETSQFILKNLDNETDSQWGVALKSGLNFVSHWTPNGLLGVFQTLASNDGPLTIHGAVTLPSDGAPPPLPVGTYPWQIESSVPGISLQIGLGFEAGFGEGMTFQDPQLRMYSPLHTNWMEDHPDYKPVMAYEGKVVIPGLKDASGQSASATMTAQKYLGVDEITIAGRFTGVSLANMTKSLSGITGGNDAITAIPESLQATLTDFDLELENAVVSLEPGDSTPYRVASTAFTIGTQLEWPIPGFEDLLRITLSSIWMYVSNPFEAAQRRLKASLSGQLKALGIDLDVTINVPGFFIAAQQIGSATLPLADLFVTHFPDLPAPPAVQVSDIRVIAQPNNVYEFSMVLAPESAWGVGDGLAIPQLRVSISNTGWYFEGSKASDTDGIPIFALMGQLADEIDGFGLPEWQALDNVTLDAFSLSYDKPDKAFTFSSQGSLAHGDERISIRVSYKKKIFRVVFESPISLAKAMKQLGLQDEFKLLLSEGAGLSEDKVWDIFDFTFLQIYYDGNSKSLAFEGRSALQAGTDKKVEVTTKAVVGKLDTQIECGWKAEGGETYHLLDLLRSFHIELEDIDTVIEGAMTINAFRLNYQFKPQPSISIAAESNSDIYEKVLVNLNKVDRKWDIAIGITFPDSGANLFALPRVDSLNLIGLDAIDFDLRYLFFANNTINNISMPSPAETSGVEHFTLKRGLTAGVALKFDAASASPLLSKTHELVGLDTLNAQVTFAPNGVQLVGQLPGTFAVPTGGTSDFELSQAYLGMQFGSGGMGIGIGGSASFELFNEIRTMSAELALTTEMLALNMHVKNGDLLANVSAIPPVFEAIERVPVMPGVILNTDEYHLQLGANFAPPAFIFGVIGSFHIGRESDPYHGDYAMILHAVPGAVKPSYIELEMETLDLWAAMEARFAIQRSLDEVGGVVSELRSLPATQTGNVVLNFSEDAIDFIDKYYTKLKVFLQQVAFTDVKIYWATDNAVLPDKRMVSRGAGFEGFMSAFGFDAYAKFEFSPGIEQGRPSIFGHAECEPISLAGIVDIRGAGKGIRNPANKWTAKQGLTLPQANHQTPANALTTLDLYRIQPGGPVLLLNTDGSPYLQANMAVTLFGFISAAVNAKIDDDGVLFSLNGKVGDTFSSTLEVTLKMDEGVPTKFEAYGDMEIDLDFVVPFPVSFLGEAAEAILHAIGIDEEVSIEDFSIHVDTSLSADVDILIDSQDLKLTIGGTFTYDGLAFTMPPLELTLPVVAFISQGINSAAKFADMIIQHILAETETMFAPIFESVAEELKGAWGDIEELVENVVKELEDIANEMLIEPAKEVIDGLTTFGETAIAATKAEVDNFINNLGEDAEQLGKEAENIINEGAQKAKEIVEAAEKKVNEIVEVGTQALKLAEEKIAEIATAIAQELSTLAEKTKKLIEAVAKEIKQFFEDAAAYADQVLGEIAEWGENLLKDAHALAANIVAAAQKIWNKIQEILDELARLAKAAAEEVVGFVEDVGSQLERGATGFVNSFASIF